MLADCYQEFKARRPAVARLARVRTVLAARPFLSSQPWWAAGEPKWRPERDIRATTAPGVGAGHVPDAEVL